MLQELPTQSRPRSRLAWFVQQRHVFLRFRHRPDQQYSTARPADSNQFYFETWSFNSQLNIQHQTTSVGFVWPILRLSFRYCQSQERFLDDKRLHYTPDREIRWYCTKVHIKTEEVAETVCLHHGPGEGLAQQLGLPSDPVLSHDENGSGALLGCRQLLFTQGFY